MVEAVAQHECPLEGHSENDVSAPDKSEVLQLVTDGVGAFASVTEALGQIRAQQSEMSKNLVDFAELVRSGTGGDSGSLQAVDACVDTTLATFDEVLAPELVKRDADDAKQAMDGLLAISRNGQNLAAVTNLTRTTVASFGIDTFENYLDDLQVTSGKIRSSAQMMSSQVTHLTARRNKLLANCKIAADGLQTVRPSLVETQATLAGLTDVETELSTEIETRATLLATKARTCMKDFVTVIQFSDRLAQRLEHLIEMFAVGQPHTTWLAARQAGGTASDLAQVLAELDRAAKTLADLSEESKALFSKGEIANALRHSLQTRSEAIQEVSSQVAGVRKAIGSARQDIKTLEKTTGSLTSNLKALEAKAKDVTAAGVNSALLAARSQGASSPLTVLSSEVRQTAQKTLEVIQYSREILNGLTDRSIDRQQRIFDRGSELEEAIAAFQRECKQGGTRLDSLNLLRGKAADDAGRLVQELTAVTAASEAVSGIVERLRGLETAYGGVQPTEEPDAEALSAVWDSYTMEEERDLHRSLYPDHAEAAPVSDAASDDIDDLLF